MSQINRQTQPAPGAFAPGAGVFFVKIPLTFPWVEGVW